jgi:hypothetical protein
MFGQEATAWDMIETNHHVQAEHEAMGRVATTDIVIQVWSDCVAAARAYRAKLSSQALFRVFETISATEELWRDPPAGAAAPISRFALFEVALKARDFAMATNAASNALDLIQDPFERTALRIAMASRAQLAHEATPVAMMVLGEDRGANEWPSDLTIDQFLLRMRCRVVAEDNEPLLRQIIDSHHPLAAAVALEWVGARWRCEGPSQALVRDNLTLARQFKQNGRLLQECLSQAFLADRELIDPLLQEFPKLARGYCKLLPLARHLRDHPALAEPMLSFAEISRHAALFDSFEAGTQSLRAMIASDASLAVVGNSPCERGRGAGGAIDAHDHVARFNFFPLLTEPDPDYGAKVTIHVRSPQTHPTLDASSLAAKWCVPCQADFTYRVRDWEQWFSLQQRGATLACLPPGAHVALRRRLRAEPSLGLAFLAYVEEVKGVLQRDQCFGFSFVDQIGPEATSAHYFDARRPALTHRWADERAIFDAMVSDDLNTN